MTDRCTCSHPWSDHAVSCYSHLGCPCNVQPLTALPVSDTATVEWLVDCAIRHGDMTTSRGAEILGISLREMQAIGVRERDARTAAGADWDLAEA